MRCMYNQIQLQMIRTIVTLALLLSLAACGGSTGSSSASGLAVKLIPAPEGRNGTYLSVQINDKDGAPVTDAKVALEGNMTHAGMAPVIADAVTDDSDGKADGVYQVPFAFTMAGDWVISLTIERNGTIEAQDIQVNVGETEVTVK